MAMDVTKIINGTFVRVYHNGSWLQNVQEANLAVNIEKVNVKRAGTRWAGHKTVGLEGVGSFRSFKVNYNLISLFGTLRNDSNPVITSLTFEVKDPEAPSGNAYITIKNVTFDNLPLLSFTVGELVEEEWNFTFTDWTRK